MYYQSEYWCMCYQYEYWGVYWGGFTNLSIEVAVISISTRVCVTSLSIGVS